jgi:hypothetical protein
MTHQRIMAVHPDEGRFDYEMSTLSGPYGHTLVHEYGKCFPLHVGGGMAMSQLRGVA